MDFKNCVRIMKKDWKTTIRNREIFLSSLLLPLIFNSIFPIIIVLSALAAPDEFISAFGDKQELMTQLNIPKNYNKYLIAVAIASRIFVLPYFLFTPSLTSVILSVDSFAGEKERKTIESLTLLPISKKELIIGKTLAAFIPSILLSFIFFVIVGIEINILVWAHLDGNILIFKDLTWLLTVFMLTPIITFLNVLISVIISSRVKSFKSAQSITSLLVTPVLAILFIQMFNPAFLSPLMIVLISAILGGLCLIFLYFGKRWLDIERLILML